MKDSIKKIAIGLIAGSILAGTTISGVMLTNQIKELEATPTPTPQIIYVTPEPVVTPEPTPEPTAKPTPEPQPTYTPIYITPDAYIYTVQPGDTLDDIANIFKVPAHWLARVNGIYNMDVLEVGQQIRIPKD